MSGNRIRQNILLKQGIKQEIAKISKNIRDQIKKLMSVLMEKHKSLSRAKCLQTAIKLVSDRRVLKYSSKG